MAYSPNWGKFLNSEKGATVKLKKQHSTATAKRLSDFKKVQWDTLGAQGLHWLVQKPADEDLNEWISMNVVDFFNELTILSAIAMESEEAEAYNGPEKGFPTGIVYNWKDPATGKLLKTSAPEYMGLVMSSMEHLVLESGVFPQNDSHTDFPPDFIDRAKGVFIKMFRMFAILFHSFHKTMQEQDLIGELSTSFKHYVYFAVCFDMLPEEKELEPLKKRVAEHKSAYLKAMKENPRPPKELAELMGHTRGGHGTTATMREMHFDDV